MGKQGTSSAPPASSTTAGGAPVRGAVDTGGGAFFAGDVTARRDVIGGDQQNYYAPVTIVQGATATDILELLRGVGILSKVTTRLPEQQFLQLIEIIARVTLRDDEQFARFYHQALPAAAHVLNDAHPSVLVADLCEQPLTRSWPPLFEFVERLRLAKGIDRAVAGELGAWVDANAGLVAPPVPPDQLELLRREVVAADTSARAGEVSYLQVYLEPDLLNRTQQRKQPLFQVELVLWSTATGGPLVVQSEQVLSQFGEPKSRWTLDELPSLLDATFAKQAFLAHIPDLSQLLIEIVAPSMVLLYGFERWKRNNAATTYGVVHPVVVRLRDRLDIPFAADRQLADDYWRRKWKAFREVCHLGCEALTWRAQQELDVYELQDDNDLACLGLSFPLLADNSEIFEVLRDAGIPVALWLRGSSQKPTVPEDLSQRIASLIQGKSLSELHRTVQQIRRSKEARADEHYFGNALTLLWDDPERPPLKYDEQGVLR